jgi:hypothetical protein
LAQHSLEDASALSLYQEGDLLTGLVRARHQAAWLQVLLDLVARQEIHDARLPPAQRRAAERWLGAEASLGQRHQRLSEQERAALRRPAFLVQPWSLAP